jgi:hypothetical protein
MTFNKIDKKTFVKRMSQVQIKYRPLVRMLYVKNIPFDLSQRFRRSNLNFSLDQKNIEIEHYEPPKTFLISIEIVNTTTYGAGIKKRTERVPETTDLLEYFSHYGLSW